MTNTPEKWRQHYAIEFGDYAHRAFKDSLPLTKLIIIQDAIERFIEENFIPKGELQQAKKDFAKELVEQLEGRGEVWRPVEGISNIRYLKEHSVINLIKQEGGL